MNKGFRLQLSSRGGAPFPGLGLATAGLMALLLWPGCRPPQPSLTPGARLEAVEGYASLTIDSEQGRGKSKVSFLIQLPDRARIDVFDALGRSLITLISRDGESFFVLVPKKAYWRGGRDEMIEKLLGFSLSLEELAGLLAWRWTLPPDAARAVRPGWSLARDSKNRVVAAERNDVIFEVKDFFPGTSTPHTLTFRSDRSSGRLKIFEVRFNASPAPDAAPLWFLENFEVKTWEGMEKLLADEAEVVR